jgi:amino acid transporter
MRICASSGIDDAHPALPGVVVGDSQFHAGTMALSLLRLLIGRPVANREAEARKLGILEGVPAMGLDALSSASYGPEAALAILAAAGAAALGQIVPIMCAILVLLAILFLSYWQTIAAYPSNGGSYVVAKDNLGTGAGLLAASALMVDYLLNVAVGISAGVGALTSAIPALHPATLWVCLGILAAITLMNLRGTRETGRAWAVPTYLFVATLGAILAWGTWKGLVAVGHPHPVVSPPRPRQTTEALSLWLVLRAFASGCTAMTGVEAVSNGVSAFREKRVSQAHGTLAVIVCTLGVLLLGVAYLARSYGVMAMDQSQPGYQSVLSQLIAAVYGRGWFYYLTIGSVLAVLCLSANTSFVGFPRLCHLVAQDGFLPRPFALPGRRLVYSAGVLFLTSGAGALLVAFGGITDRLIPLFAIGAFLAFTLSQAGMAAHWRHALRQGTDPNAASTHLMRAKLAINGLGAIATGIALAIIIAAKFMSGAWLTLIVIPLAVVLLRSVRRYYDDLDRHILFGCHLTIDLQDQTQPTVLVPIERWDMVSRKAVEFALRLSPDVTALHITDLEGPDAEDKQHHLREEWRKFVAYPATSTGLQRPKLKLLHSEFRSVLAPVLRETEAVERRCPGRPIIVVLPELVEASWWQYMMHTHRDRRLRAKLLRQGGPHVGVAIVPWQVQQSDPDAAIAEEEPSPADQSNPPLQRAAS